MFLEVDEDFPDHPKTRRFCVLIQNRQTGWAWVIALWRWATKYAKDGDVSGYSVAEVEDSLGWTMGDGKLYDAFVKAGFLDVGEDKAVQIHDWHKHQGKWIARMESDRQRSRDRRNGRRREDGGATDGGSPSLHDLAEMDRQTTIPVASLDSPRTVCERPKTVDDSLAKQREEKIQSVPSEHTPSTGVEYPEAFERLWAATGRVGNKYPALLAWQKMKKPDADAVIAGWRLAERHDKRWQGRDPHIPHLATWLADRGWEDDPSQTRRGPAPTEATPFKKRQATFPVVVIDQREGAGNGNS